MTAAGVVWSLPRIAGTIIVGSAFLLLVVDVALVMVGGDLRAAEAMFRDIRAAVGHARSLRIMSLTWGAWSVAVLAGFTVLTVELWTRDVQVVPTLALVGLTVFSVAWIIEAAFHASMTVWAVGQLEQGHDVPALFEPTKDWLNYWLQILVNPLALLSLLAFAVVSTRQQLIPSWSGWTVAIWSGVFVFFPLPLAIAPAALFFGVVLLVYG